MRYINIRLLLLLLPVKIVPNMIYNVFGETLNYTLLLLVLFKCHLFSKGSHTLVNTNTVVFSRSF